LAIEASDFDDENSVQCADQQHALIPASMCKAAQSLEQLIEITFEIEHLLDSNAQGDSRLLYRLISDHFLY
jgi:hypothetical protein